MTPFRVGILPRSDIEDIYRIVSETLAGSAKKGIETVTYYVDVDDAPSEQIALGYKVLLEHRAKQATIYERSRRKPNIKATQVNCLGTIKSVTPLNDGSLMLFIGDHILTLIPEVTA